MNPALARNNDAEMYNGKDVETASKIPVSIGTVIPASRDRADATPVALPLYKANCGVSLCLMKWSG